MHTSYGIVTQLDSVKDGTAMITAYAHDVTSDKWALTELVSLCNRLELSIVHLMDVMEDYSQADTYLKKQKKLYN